MEQELISKKINTLEQELKKLKILMSKSGKIVSLKGILKGVKVTEKDIEEAKNSLFH